MPIPNPSILATPHLCLEGEDTRLKRRQYAAQLLELVLDEQIEPRLAINRWPETKESKMDWSLACALQALWHFEADADKQQSELFYMDLQWGLLKQMAIVLAKGDDLPPNILKQYWPVLKKSRVRFFYGQGFWQDCALYLKDVLQEWHDTVLRVFKSTELLRKK